MLHPLVARAARHTLPREKGLIWLIELYITVVATRAYGLLRPCARLDTSSLTLTVLPVNHAPGRLYHLILLDLVCSRTNLGWIVDQSAHFADVARSIGFLLVSINDWS